MYNYKFEKGHCIIDIDGNKWFLDNGSPYTFSFDDDETHIIIDNNTIRLKSNPGFRREAVESAIGKKIKGIIGTDILSKSSFSIYNNNQMEFKANVNKETIENSIDFEMINNAIIFKAKIENQLVNVLFDSGAAINYLLPNVFRSGIGDEVIKDIDSSGQVIESNHCMAITYLGNKQCKLNFGVPMDNYCKPMQVMSYYSCSAIIGLYDFYYKNPIFSEYFLMDYENKKIYIK